MSQDGGHRRSKSVTEQLAGLSEAEKIEYLEKRLAEKDAQLVQAAQMGKALFTELNETKAKLASGKSNALLDVDAGELEQQLASVKATLDAKEEELQSLRQHYEGREAQQSGLVAELQQLRQESGSLREQLASMESQHDRLQDQVDEYELRVSSLSEALDGSKKEIERLRRFEGKALKSARETGSEIEASKQETQLLRDQIEDMQKLENKLLQDNRKLEQQLAQLGGELALLRDAEAAKSEPLQKQVQRLNEALRDVRTEVETLRLDKEQLQAERSKLADVVLSLTKENRNLIKEREENLTFLNEARASVNALLAKQTEHSAISEGALDASLVDPMMDNSLLGELEKELANRLKSEPQGEPIKQAHSGGGFSGEEEYFFWLISAIKTSLLMKHPHHCDEVAAVQPRTLYQEARKIDYYEWHHWIEEQLLEKIHVTPLPSNYKPTPLPAPRRSAKTSSSSSSSSSSGLSDFIDDSFM